MYCASTLRCRKKNHLKTKKSGRGQLLHSPSSRKGAGTDRFGVQFNASNRNDRILKRQFVANQSAVYREVTVAPLSMDQTARGIA